MSVTPTALEQRATQLREKLREWYDVPVVRVCDEWLEVPAGNAVQRAREISGGTEQEIRPIDTATLPWFRVPVDGLRLWRAHGRAGDEVGELVTELIAGDPPVQVVITHDGWSLVTAADGATGWVEPSVELTDSAARPATIIRHVADPDRIADMAEEFIGVPYRWGGSSRVGVDCSGLVQRAAWMAGGAWLPRHSRHLLHVGRRVGINRLQRGDVLVLKNSGARLSEQSSPDPGSTMGGPAVHPMHVAIALSSEEVLHASRQAWAVVREPLDSLLMRYRVLGVRRLDGGS
jgi:cell wall-associated NlpC family hydrolase